MNSVRMSKRLIDIFSKVEEYHWWFEGRRILLKEIIYGFKEMERNYKILDVGSGSGSNLKFLSNFGVVYGIDNFRIAVKYCHQKGFKNVRVANANKLPYKNSTFDLITLLDVLEHIKDDVSALNEAKRVLKPGGRVIVTSPSLPLIWSKHDTLQGHFRRYRKKDMQDLGNITDLKVSYLNHYNVFLSPLIIAIRLATTNLKFLSKYGEYDSKINFDIASRRVINKALLKLINLEVRLSRFFNYPIGISVVAVFDKKPLRRKI